MTRQPEKLVEALQELITEGKVTAVVPVVYRLPQGQTWPSLPVVIYRRTEGATVNAANGQAVFMAIELTVLDDDYGRVTSVMNDVIAKLRSKQMFYLQPDLPSDGFDEDLAEGVYMQDVTVHVK